MPCSGSKRTGGAQASAANDESLPVGPALATDLRRARERLAPDVQLDESLVMPAWRRYTGAFYDGAAPVLRRAAEGELHVLIVSGGYGLVRPGDAIGWYERRFSRRDWPPGLLERTLSDYLQRHELDRVAGFLARTTGYAKLVRRVDWAAAGARTAVIFKPVSDRRGGALRAVPQTLGQAFATFLDDRLSAVWLSDSGWPLTVEDLLARR